MLLGLLRSTPALDWYVATNGAGLGTNGWADATNNLQGAINMASASTFDVVWVSNGVYDAGGTTNYPAGTLLTNRIVIAKSITVRSQNNDPTNTIIKGAWNSAATTNGPAAVRCVYMSGNSVLIGFTLTNGATLTNGTEDRYGGGVYCPNTNPILTNCIITGNTAYGTPVGFPGGGGAYYGTLYNCSLIGNAAFSYGGGAEYSRLFYCLLSGNMGVYGGGGALGTTLYNCTVISNRATASNGAGGGTYDCNLYNCTLTGNTVHHSWYGGGAYSFSGNNILYNCTLTGNYAGNGGGAYAMLLYNCLLTDNTADHSGGGTDACHLKNCTVVSNTAWDGGGVNGGSRTNCIVYFNRSVNPAVGASSNWNGGTFGNSCTAPSNAGWAVGNITGDPMFANKDARNYRLSSRSPCVNVGTNISWMTDGSVTSRDLDNRQRVRYGAVDMGAFENIRSGTIYGFR